MVIKLKKVGLCQNPDNYSIIVRKLAQQGGRQRAIAVAALTNNAGGSAGTVSKAAAFVGAAASGSNLADKTTSEAAFTTVLDAVRELYSKANALAAVLGLTQITYSGGGAAPDGTIAAVTVAVTGATTGILVANSNTFLTALNTAIYNLTVLVNQINVATDNPLVALGYSGSLLTTIGAITISGGTAASPAVTQVEAQAALTTLRANVTTLAGALNTVVGNNGALVCAV